MRKNNGWRWTGGDFWPAPPLFRAACFTSCRATSGSAPLRACGQRSARGPRPPVRRARGQRRGRRHRTAPTELQVLRLVGRARAPDALLPVQASSRSTDALELRDHAQRIRLAGSACREREREWLRSFGCAAFSESRRLRGARVVRLQPRSRRSDGEIPRLRAHEASVITIDTGASEKRRWRARVSQVPRPE